MPDASDPRLRLSPELEPFATAIGALCMTWGKLEERVLELLSYLMGFPHQEGAGDAMLRCFDFQDQLAAAKLGVVDKVKDLKCAEHLISTIDYIDNTLRTRRNRFVHDWWSAHQGLPIGASLSALRLNFSAYIFRQQSHQPRDWMWRPSMPTELEDLAVTVDEIDVHSEFLSDLWLAYLLILQLGSDHEEEPRLSKLLEAPPPQRLQPLPPAILHPENSGG